MAPGRGLVGAVLVALLIAVAGIGCGGGKSADQALAEAALLRSSDLPEWRADSDVDETVAGTCVDFDVAGLVATGRAHSDWFRAPPWESGLLDVVSFSGVHESSAEHALETLGKEATACFHDERASGGGVLGRLVKSVTTIREVRVPRLGERSRAYEVKSGIGPLAVYDEIVLIQKGRSLVLLYLSFDQSASDAASSLRVELATKLASRM